MDPEPPSPLADLVDDLAWKWRERASLGSVIGLLFLAVGSLAVAWGAVYVLTAPPTLAPEPALRLVSGRIMAEVATGGWEPVEDLPVGRRVAVDVGVAVLGWGTRGSTLVLYQGTDVTCLDGSPQHLTLEVDTGLVEVQTGDRDGAVLRLPNGAEMQVQEGTLAGLDATGLGPHPVLEARVTHGNATVAGRTLGSGEEVHLNPQGVIITP